MTFGDNPVPVPLQVLRNYNEAHKEDAITEISARDIIYLNTDVAGYTTEIERVSTGDVSIRQWSTKHGRGDNYDVVVLAPDAWVDLLTKGMNHLFRQ